MKSIVIIGGGFSGTVTAVNLIRLTSLPLRISVISQSAIPCRGVAYSTPHPCHLLNVLARNMSALADQPHHFVEWLATRSEYLHEPIASLREKFVPRCMYGDYLHNLYQWHAGTTAAEKGLSVDWIHDGVEGLTCENQQAQVILKGGQAIVADKVILATGNQPPSLLRIPGLDPQSRTYIGNPWRGWEARLPPKDRDLVLVGSGLTMADVFLTLQELGWQGKIIAVSRHGLLPWSHFKGFEYPAFRGDESLPTSLKGLLALFRRHVDEITRLGLSPAILVDKLRPHTQRLWQNLSVGEKRRFNLHLRTYWNVLRHRLAPEIHRQLEAAIAAGKLEVVAGRLAHCASADDHVGVKIGRRGATRTVTVGAVINCTGPRESYFPSSPGDFFESLLSRGLITADAMNMGIQVGPDFAVRGQDGIPSTVLFALGSLLKGTLWETTAVPELRSQAFRLAETIANQMLESTWEKRLISEDVIEYFI